MKDPIWVLGGLCAATLLYVTAHFCYIVGRDDGYRKNIDRRISAHENHREISAVQKGVKLLACRDCGVVFDPQFTGLAMSDKDWDRMWMLLDYAK